MAITAALKDYERPTLHIRINIVDDVSTKSTYLKAIKKHVTGCIFRCRENGQGIDLIVQGKQPKTVVSTLGEIANMAKKRGDRIIDVNVITKPPTYRKKIRIAQSWVFPPRSTRSSNGAPCINQLLTGIDADDLDHESISVTSSDFQGLEREMSDIRGDLDNVTQKLEDFTQKVDTMSTTLQQMLLVMQALLENQQ